MIAEYLSIKEFGTYTGIPARSLEGWKSEGFLPPHFEFTSRHHRWKKSDIDAWSDLRRRGLLDEYQALRDRLGVYDAWAVLLARLDAIYVSTAAVVAAEVQR